MKNFQSGFSLVSAIFLLVVLAGMGAAMLTFSSSQQQSSAMDIMGSRAYQAARAGIEWATYQVTNPAGPTCPASTTLTLGATTLSAFTVTVTCTITAISNDTIANFYLVTSTASIGTVGKPDYIERMVTAKLGM